MLSAVVPSRRLGVSPVSIHSMPRLPDLMSAHSNEMLSAIARIEEHRTRWLSAHGDACHGPSHMQIELLGAQLQDLGKLATLYRELASDLLAQPPRIDWSRAPGRAESRENEAGTPFEIHCDRRDLDELLREFGVSTEKLAATIEPAAASNPNEVWWVIELEIPEPLRGMIARLGDRIALIYVKIREGLLAARARFRLDDAREPRILRLEIPARPRA
jgi:hypothetical protein